MQEITENFKGVMQADFADSSFATYTQTEIALMTAIDFGSQESPYMGTGPSDSTPRTVVFHPVLTQFDLPVHLKAVLTLAEEAIANDGREEGRASLLNWAHDKILEKYLQKIIVMVHTHALIYDTHTHTLS
jgi:hypothetical protein